MIKGRAYLYEQSSEYRPGRSPRSVMRYIGPVKPKRIKIMEVLGELLRPPTEEERVQMILERFERQLDETSSSAPYLKQSQPLPQSDEPAEGKETSSEQGHQDGQPD